MAFCAYFLEESSTDSSKNIRLTRSLLRCYPDRFAGHAYENPGLLIPGIQVGQEGFSGPDLTIQTVLLKQLFQQGICCRIIFLNYIKVK